MGRTEDAQQTHHVADSKFLNFKMQLLLFNSLHWNLEILFLVPIGYRIFRGRKDEQIDPYKSPWPPNSVFLCQNDVCIINLLEKSEGEGGQHNLIADAVNCILGCICCAYINIHMHR